jgi:hypothetical protein
MILYYPLRSDRRYVYSVKDAERRGGPVRVSRRVELLEEGENARGVWREETEGAPVRSYPVLSGASGVTEDGVWIVKAPLQPGTVWRDGADERRIFSLEESVAVPAGRFSGCLRVDYGNDDLGWGRMVFAPAVGLVFWSQHGERGAFTWELERVDEL